jgi:hypothetical protein
VAISYFIFATLSRVSCRVFLALCLVDLLLLLFLSFLYSSRFGRGWIAGKFLSFAGEFLLSNLALLNLSRLCRTGSCTIPWCCITARCVGVVRVVVVAWYAEV